MDIDKVEKLLELMDNHGLQEVEIEQGDTRIKLKKSGEPVAPAPMIAAAPMVHHAVPMVVNGAAPAAPVAQEAAPAAPVADPSLVEVTSPMVGTFYNAPAPDADPFVSEGDTIAADTVVCIIEAMKVMNEIRSEFAGEVVQVLVENGESVEYGQPLVVIRKADGA
jgi:acetyl-CoA carboxylase biotin carboxyl carrier protein